MKTIIWLVIVSLPFFNFFIFTNISFADVGLIIGCFGLFFYDNKSIIFLREKKYNYLIYILIWVVLSSLLLLLDNKNNYINSLGIIKNILRFLMIVYFFIKLKFIFRNNFLQNYLFKTWIKVIYFICLLGFVEYLLQFFGIYYSYYFDGITTTTGRISKESFRISSIFNEPSYLVIYLNFSLLVITEFYSQYKLSFKLNYKRFLYLIVLTTALAQSIVGFILLTFILISYKEMILGNMVKKNKFQYIIIISLLSALIIFINKDRIQGIYYFEDGSANHRLLGSLELANVIIEKNYFLTGIGLGQQKGFLSSKSINFTEHYFNISLGTGSGINNMFVLVFFQLGSVGLFLYLLFLYKTFKRRKSIFIFLIISGFGWAFTLNPLYWFSISILNILINGRKKNLIHLN